MTERFVRISVVVALACAVAASAQQVTVVPRSMTAPGGTSISRPGSRDLRWYPFGYGVSRQMQLYERGYIDVPSGASLTRIGFPKDDGHSSDARRVLVDFDVGPTTRTRDSIALDFAANFSAPPTRVITRRVVDLPALVPGVPGFWVAFDRPFAFDASLGFVTDARVHANSYSNVPFDYWVDAGSYAGQYLGLGCVQLPRIDLWRNPALWSAQGCVFNTWFTSTLPSPSGPAVLAVGTTAVPAGIPLEPIGAPGCWLRIQPLAFVTPTTTSPLRFVLTYQVPYSLVGSELQMQGFVSAPGANALGWLASGAVSVPIALRTGSRILLATGDAEAVTGWLGDDVGPITWFQWH
ncbi:MAG: hypothetical protein HZB39_09410 [Planctomycetes bacterium]|nr:hypothetical protein [Planctomycetota bacterium]